MDDFFMAWMFGVLGGAGSAVDWVALLGFFAVALIYIIVPAIGYRSDRRGMIGAALFCLIGYAALSMFQFAIQYLFILERSGRGGQEPVMHVFFVFTLLKTLVLIVAMLLFAVGVQSLRLRNPDDDDRYGSGSSSGSFRRPGRDDDA